MAKPTMERVSAIFKSNVNDVLDRIEDPVKMVEQIARDVEDAVDQAVVALARAMATEQRWAREQKRNAEQIRAWQDKAEKAVEADDEEYARLVLAQKAKLEQANIRLQPALDESCATAAHLRLQVEELRGKLGAVRARRDKIVARHRSGLPRGEGPLVGVADEVEAMARFAAIEQRVKGHERDLARFEEQVDQLAAEAEVQREWNEERRVERELEQTERDRRVEDELAALKADKSSPTI